MSNHTRLSPMSMSVLIVAYLAAASSAHAAITVRHFEFGESDLNASGLPAQVGDVVVSTHNLLGEVFLPDDPTRMNLFPVPGTSPIYVEGRNGPGSLAIEFDGSTNDAGFPTQLVGNRFCSFCRDPDVSRALSEATDGQFFGTFNRGFQAWLNPDPAGEGLEQLAIGDGGEVWGGVGITPDGNWLHISFRFGIREETDTGIPVEFGKWAHVAEIVTGNFATLYVNGVLVDVRSLGFGPVASSAPLTVAVRRDGTTDPFLGAVDDLKFMLTSVVVGGFNPRFDLDFFEGIVFSGVEGDINQDGIVDQADVDIWAENVGLSLDSVANSISVGFNPGALLLGDANQNGLIDLTDFAIIKHAALAQGNLVVPEPGTLALLGFAMLALARRRAAPVSERSSVRF